MTGALAVCLLIGSLATTGRLAEAASAVRQWFANIIAVNNEPPTNPSTPAETPVASAQKKSPSAPAVPAADEPATPAEPTPSAPITEVREPVKVAPKTENPGVTPDCVTPVAKPATDVSGFAHGYIVQTNKLSLKPPAK